MRSKPGCVELFSGPWGVRPISEAALAYRRTWNYRATTSGHDLGNEHFLIFHPITPDPASVAEDACHASQFQVQHLAWIVFTFTLAAHMQSSQVLVLQFSLLTQKGLVGGLSSGLFPDVLRPGHRKN